MARLTFVFVMMAIVLFLGAGAMSAANVEGASTTEIVNETWTPDAGTYVVLDSSRLAFTDYNDTVTVRDENGTAMVDGIDYDWNSSFEEGTVAALAGGGLDGDANATITYRFDEPSGEQQGVFTVLFVMIRSLNTLLIVPIVALFLAATFLWTRS